MEIADRLAAALGHHLVEVGRGAKGRARPVAAGGPDPDVYSVGLSGEDG